MYRNNRSLGNAGQKTSLVVIILFNKEKTSFSMQNNKFFVYWFYLFA